MIGEPKNFGSPYCPNNKERFMGIQKEKVDRIFNRLRARLYNMIEQLPLNTGQMDAAKSSIRDCTSSAWNSISKFTEEEEE